MKDSLLPPNQTEKGIYVDAVMLFLPQEWGKLGTPAGNE